MRMRTKSWVEDYLNEHPKYLITDPTVNKGKWREILNYPKLNLEIGCGKGDYFLSMAEKYPEEAWIALEKEKNCVGVALRKAEEKQLNNILLLFVDAANLLEYFEKDEVSSIYLNFSDPWPKKRTTKRRLTSDSFIDQYLCVLEDTGKLYFKTDNTKLFEYSLVSMDEKWKLEEVWLDFDSEANNDAVTEYERRFKSENVPIKRAIFSKRKR